MITTSPFEAVKQAARKVNLLSSSKITTILRDLAEKTEASVEYILEANARDLSRMDPADPKYDRLKLTEARIQGIAADIRNVAALPSPLNRTIQEKNVGPLHLRKMSVPLGVIGIIYEARPNVTFDVFALCLKSGNACILKGGSDAEDSNKAIVSVIHDVLTSHNVTVTAATLLPSDRSATEALLRAVDAVDIIIPRGSQGLINYVREHSRVPVIETGAGIVHTYVDKDAALDVAQSVITNAKMRRVSVCNALDCLLIHQERLDALPKLVSELKSHPVQLYADDLAFEQLSSSYPSEALHSAQPEHFGTEFLSHALSIKTVGSVEEAMDHISRYSSKHSEAIITQNTTTASYFQQSVDAAVIYVNTSTAFTDGGQFGLGAEIGISTQKLHARGPMALEELTSYKWLVTSDGATRP